MKRIGMFLNGDIQNDTRVINIIQTLSIKYYIDLFFISNKKQLDFNLFNKNVCLYPSEIKMTPWIQFKSLIFIEAPYSFLLKKLLEKGKSYDYIHANDLPTLPIANSAARILGAKLIYDSHEIFVETINQFFNSKNFIKKNIFDFLIKVSKFFAKRTEKKLLKTVKLFITTNYSYRDYFLSIYKSLPEHIILFNCPRFLKYEKNNRLRKEFPEIENKKIILYQGIFNSGRGLFPLINSAKYLPEEFVIVLLGKGILENPLKKEVIKNGIQDKVLFLGFKNEKELLTYTMSADLGVLILSPVNLSKKFASANKVFQYMAASVPVLLTNLPENKKIVEECNCGKLFSEINAEVIAQNIIEVFKDKDNYTKWAKNGRDCFEKKYHWENQEKYLLDAYQNI